MDYIKCYAGAIHWFEKSGEGLPGGPGIRQSMCLMVRPIKLALSLTSSAQTVLYILSYELIYLYGGPSPSPINSQWNTRWQCLWNQFHFQRVKKNCWQSLYPHSQSSGSCGMITPTFNNQREGNVFCTLPYLQRKKTYDESTISNIKKIEYISLI